MVIIQLFMKTSSIDHVALRQLQGSFQYQATLGYSEEVPGGITDLLFTLTPWVVIQLEKTERKK